LTLAIATGEAVASTGLAASSEAGLRPTPGRPPNVPPGCDLGPPRLGSTLHDRTPQEQLL